MTTTTTKWKQLVKCSLDTYGLSEYDDDDDDDDDIENIENIEKIENIENIEFYLSSLTLILRAMLYYSRSMRAIVD